MSNSVPLRLEQSSASPGAAVREHLAAAIHSALFLQSDLTQLQQHKGLIAVMARHELEVLNPMIKRLQVIAEVSEHCGCLAARH